MGRGVSVRPFNQASERDGVPAVKNGRDRLTLVIEIDGNGSEVTYIGMPADIHTVPYLQAPRGD